MCNRPFANKIFEAGDLGSIPAETCFFSGCYSRGWRELWKMKSWQLYLALFYIFKTFKAVNVKKIWPWLHFSLYGVLFTKKICCVVLQSSAVNVSDHTLCKIGFRGLIQKAGNFKNTHYSKKTCFSLAGFARLYLSRTHSHKYAIRLLFSYFLSRTHRRYEVISLASLFNAVYVFKGPVARVRSRWYSRGILSIWSPHQQG
jgi:hypothetical protein